MGETGASVASADGADGVVDLAVVLIRRAHAVQRRMAHALRGAPIGVQHWLILDHLAGREGATMGDLAEAAAIPAATVTRAVDRLVDHALVYRSLGVEDRRQVLVRITDRGRGMRDEWSQVLADAVGAELPGLRDWEQGALRGLLGSVAATP
ncbi:MAG: MarR family transcriptional regulator [Mobilicoccus sp.]|nr:MarR family transcriptional regulator [Mobilicoccus sp.]